MYIDRGRVGAGGGRGGRCGRGGGGAARQAAAGLPHGVFWAIWHCRPPMNSPRCLFLSRVEAAMEPASLPLGSSMQAASSIRPPLLRQVATVAASCVYPQWTVPVSFLALSQEQPPLCGGCREHGTFARGRVNVSRFFRINTQEATYCTKSRNSGLSFSAFSWRGRPWPPPPRRPCHACRPAAAAAAAALPAPLPAGPPGG